MESLCPHAATHSARLPVIQIIKSFSSKRPVKTIAANSGINPFSRLAALGLTSEPLQALHGFSSAR
jgi:hypothetical protein